MIDFPILFVTGGLAGVLAGLLGIGGGVIIVPVLVFVFQYQGVDSSLIMQVAIGTSLATIVATSASSARAHHRHGAVLWPVVEQIAPGVVVGSLFGAAVADALPSDTLRLIFVPFMLLVALQFATNRVSKPHRQLPATPAMVGIGGVIGVISALFGIGGGSLSVPFLTWCNVSVRKAVATSAAIGIPIALAGGVGFVVAGWDAPGLPAWSLGYVNLPATFGVVTASALAAPLGAKLAHQLPEKILQRIFAALLVVLAVKLYLS